MATTTKFINGNSYIRGQHDTSALSLPTGILRYTKDKLISASKESTNTLVFTQDTQELYVGGGVKSPLLRVTDVIIKPTTETFPEIGSANKIYIATADGKICYWNNNEYHAIGITAEIFEDEMKDLENRLNLNIDKAFNGISSTIEYEDSFIVEDVEQNTFVLTKMPISKIKMYINGIRYFSNCFEYNKETNTVKWLFNELSNGFSIIDSQVVFEYNINTEENI